MNICKQQAEELYYAAREFRAAINRAPVPPTPSLDMRYLDAALAACEGAAPCDEGPTAAPRRRWPSVPYGVRQAVKFAAGTLAGGAGLTVGALCVQAAADRLHRSP